MKNTFNKNSKHIFGQSLNDLKVFNLERWNDFTVLNNKTKLNDIVYIIITDLTENKGKYHWKQACYEYYFYEYSQFWQNNK